MATVQCRSDQRGVGLAAACLCAALILPACVKQAPEPVSNAPVDASAAQAGELNWARDALKRNPSLEVVATDTSAGVFTVRIKETGEMRTVKASELAAVPVSSLTEPARTAATEPAVSPSEPTTSAPAQPERVSQATPAETTAATQPDSTSNYTIERSDGQVKVSGPGVSIVSSGTTTVTPSEGASGQRSIEPIICEGRRMLHLDNRNIYVDGNAIVARGGCELYITNSRVSASGTAVVVGDATVHIANSSIEGKAASFEAADQARVYVRSSTFQGLPRRAENAVVQDQGGNEWR